jgi:hemoglobin
MTPKTMAITTRRSLLQRRAFAAGSLLIALAASLAARPARAADDALFQAFGGKPGLVRLVDDFVPRLVADPRLHTFFEKADLEHLKEGLVAQFCEVSGGGCAYGGPTMAVAHQDMEIRTSDFNALVEDLQHAMDAQGLPFATQNRLLAKLAPMHREIVNTH